MDIKAFFENSIVTAAIRIVICLLAAYIVLSLTDKMLKKIEIEATTEKFLHSLAKIIVYVVTILIAASCLGFDMTSMVALVSVVSAAFALAAQNTLSNFFGGVLLLITKPIRVGEYINTAAGEGTVQEVGIMTTVMRTVDNRVVNVPNSTIVSGTITNFSREENRRVDLDFNVSYDADIDHVYAVMLKIVNAHPLVLKEKEPPFVRVTAFGENGVTYTLRAWCKGSDYWTLRFDLLEGIKKAFDREGIVIPYNHVNVHMIQDK